MEIEENTTRNRSFGHLKCFGFIANEPLFCIGPHCTFYLGPFFLCLYSSILLIAFFFMVFVCPSVGPTNTAIGALIFGFLLLNYFLAAFLNPGIDMGAIHVNKPEFSDPDDFCCICEIYRSPKSEHCDDCGVCISEYDHHCPWTSKCIGKGNLYYFYGFLTGMFLSFVFCIGTLAMKAGSRHGH
jgi:hypothetical protein